MAEDNQLPSIVEICIGCIYQESHCDALLFYSFFLFAIYCSAPVKPAVSQISPPSSLAAVPLPVGYHRIYQSPASFGSWLRKLPLKPDKTVHLFDGRPKRNQTAQYAVLDVSVGKKDLQQCADAIIRLKAEYLYGQQNYAAIRFHATDGTLLDYESWKQGHRFPLRRGRLQKVLNATPAVDRTY